MTITKEFSLGADLEAKERAVSISREPNLMAMAGGRRPGYDSSRWQP
ncbi:MAG TPA: hypothetical protein VIX59_18865 [Candidatus Binataceae bacterium]